MCAALDRTVLPADLTNLDWVSPENVTSYIKRGRYVVAA